MPRFLVLPLIALLASQSAHAQSVDTSVPAHCKPEPLDLYSSAWEQKLLSGGTFRLAVDPDTGRGPNTAVTLESGKIRDPTNPANEPYLLAAVGDEKRSCAVRMSFAQCPAARGVVAQLKEASLPLGLGLEEASGMSLVLHASRYHLDSVDGFGNHHKLVFRQAGHPFEALITESLRALEACVRPATDAYHER